MVGHEMALQHHIAVNLHDVVARGAGNGFVEDKGLPESLVLMPNVNKGHGKALRLAGYQPARLLARPVIGYHYLIGKNGLALHTVEHLGQSLRPIVGGNK